MTLHSLIRMACAAATFVVVAAAGRADEKPPAPIRVIFVGNSQIYYNELPKIVEALADSAPTDQPRIRVDWKPTARAVAGGASLESHWKKGEAKDTARAKLADESWDFVVLQDYSGVTTKESFTTHARLFGDAIAKRGAKTIFLTTAHFPNKVPKGFTEVHERHVPVAKELKAQIAAGGMSWLEFWGENPSEEQILALYDKDKGHPGPKGSYLYACALYAAITGRSPVGLTNKLPHLPEARIGTDEAKRYQEAAWKVHQRVNGKDSPLR